MDELIRERFTRPQIPLEISGSPELFAPDDPLIERAKSSKNGERFGRLWNTDTSDFGDDHSRADLALCRMLAVWCKGDFERVDRLFRRSGLMREKWDRVAGGMRYGERTILAISTDSR
jgi:primase-polymerase (primpol)-like protein